jgi:hypothetical protein
MDLEATTATTSFYSGTSKIDGYLFASYYVGLDQHEDFDIVLS